MESNILELRQYEYILNGKIDLILDNKLLSSRIDLLNNENNNLKVELSKANQILFTKNEQIEIFSLNIDNYRKEVGKLKEARDTLNKQNEDLQTEYFKQVEEDKAKTRQINHLESENRTLRHEIDRLKESFFEKDKELNTFIYENKNLNTLVIEMKNTISNLNYDASMSKFNKDTLENEISSLRSEVLHLKRLLDEEQKSQEFTLLNHNEKEKLLRMDIINQEQKHLKAVSELEHEINKLNNTNSFVNNRVAELNAQITSDKLKISEYTKAIEELKKLIKEKDVEILLLKDIIREDEREYKKLEMIKRLDTFSQFEKLLETRQILTGSDISELREKINELFRYLIKTYQKLSDEGSIIDNKLNPAVFDLSSEKQKVIELKDLEIKKLKEQLDEAKKELNYYDEYTTILNKQNKELLFSIKFATSQKSYLAENLTTDEYRGVLYKNIEDMDAKFSKLLKENIKLKKDLNDYESIKKLLQEKMEVISKLESYSNDLQKTNNILKEEYDFIKYNIDNPFNGFISRYSQADLKGDINLGIFSEVNDLKAKVEGLNTLVENKTNELRQKEEEVNRLFNNVSELRTTLIDKEREINNLKSHSFKFEQNYDSASKILANKNNELVLLNAEINNLKQQIITLNSDKNYLSNDLVNKLNNQYNKLIETKELLQGQLDIVNNFNKDIKLSIENTYKLLSVSEQGQFNLFSSNADDYETKIKQIQRELVNLKNQNCELKSQNENLRMENYQSKTNIEFLQNRVDYYSKIMREREIVVTPSENAFNNVIIDSNNVTNTTNNNITELNEKYLESLKNIENLKNDIFKFQFKIQELNDINEKLVKNDLETGPYRYLISKIETLQEQIISLQNENKSLSDFKDNKLNNFLFLSKRNEQLEIQYKEQVEINKKLFNDINMLEGQINQNKEILSSVSLLNQVLKEKDDLISTLTNDKQALLNNIDKLNKSQEEKEKLFQQDNEKLKYSLLEDQNKHQQEIEIKKKEVEEQKNKTFKHFYLAFRKARNVIDGFMKLKVTLEERVNSLETAVNNNKDYETQVETMKAELNLLREKEKDMVNEIKTFKTIWKQNEEGSGVPRPEPKIYLSKLIKHLNVATHVLNFNKLKIKELETVIETLSEENRKLALEKSGEDDKVLFKNSIIENNILKRDLNTLVKHMKDVNDDGNNNINANVPQNKAFSNLISLMRKATRIISALDNTVKNVNENILEKSV
jgi:chromosome segregation ATPase